MLVAYDRSSFLYGTLFTILFCSGMSAGHACDRHSLPIGMISPDPPEFSDTENTEKAQKKTEEGLLLLRYRNLRSLKMAEECFTEAIKLDPNLYNARRARAVLKVLEGNNYADTTGECYRAAVADMKAIKNRLRIVIPESMRDVEVYSPSTEHEGRKRFHVIATVSRRDVLEVDGVEEANGAEWLRVRGIHFAIAARQDEVPSVFPGYVLLNRVATPEADDSQLRDLDPEIAAARRPAAETMENFRRQWSFHASDPRDLHSGEFNFGSTPLFLHQELRSTPRISPKQLNGYDRLYFGMPFGSGTHQPRSSINAISRP